MSSLVSFDSFEGDGYIDDYEEGYYTDHDKTPRHLYIKDGIIAREQEEGSWWVINGHWDGHIDENGEFICDYTGDSCGKKDEVIIITGEEWENAGVQPNDQYGLLRAKKAVKDMTRNLSIRKLLQNETDSWLTGVLN